MSYQPLEKLLPRAASSIYRLVLLASKRATELAEGMPKLLERPATMKLTTLALDEVLEGRVVLKGCEDQLYKTPEAVADVKESKGKKEKE
jgi:DNA-directed RNA polymerase subunit K/omega